MIADIPWPRPGSRCTVRSSCPSPLVCCLTQAEEHIPDPGGERAEKPKPRDYGQHPHLPVTVMRPPPWKAGGRRREADKSPPFRVASRLGAPDQGPSNKLLPCSICAAVKKYRCCQGSNPCSPTAGPVSRREGKTKKGARPFSLLTWHAEPLARPFGLPIGMYLYDVERIGYSFCSSQAVVLETQCQCPGGLVALGD